MATHLRVPRISALSLEFAKLRRQPNPYHRADEIYLRAENTEPNGQQCFQEGLARNPSSSQAKSLIARVREEPSKIRATAGIDWSSHLPRPLVESHQERPIDRFDVARVVLVNGCACVRQSGASRETVRRLCQHVRSVRPRTHDTDHRSRRHSQSAFRRSKSGSLAKFVAITFADASMQKR